MEYEAYEPDREDEYYDEMCSVAYLKMFNEGRDREDVQRVCDVR